MTPSRNIVVEHKHIPGLVDVIKVDQPADILQIARDGTLDRAFGTGKPFLNSLLVRRILGVLSLKGHRFPTMSARKATGREIQQDALWQRLNAIAPDIRTAPADLEPLAAWVRDTNTDVAVGPLVQQVIGRLFSPTFEAGEATWAAAEVIAASLAPGNALRNLVWQVTGKVTRAKALLASMVGGDLAGVHAVGVAIHNVVKGLNQMRGLYLDASVRQTLTPEMASRRCLFAPAVVLRQATEGGTVGGCPYSAGTLLLLELEKARQTGGDESMIFLADTWSRCPAEQWVPAMLEGVWRRATSAHEQ
ncbi:hypothetical protein BamIOP4010DRAFT_0362 [Burkholderia ambifaria IOP40-10]|uniref:Uncharacterized protein n=1 Tax=Burkholderia ambifaria IOP40-10 TaxID=396596 RepID=B1F8K3_9BURK|nr:hypothetical protein BamIOP4010DRAFT_0362 [Burkholderia ambifaria IOP40-10]